MEMEKLDLEDLERRSPKELLELHEKCRKPIEDMKRIAELALEAQIRKEMNNVVYKVFSTLKQSQRPVINCAKITPSSPHFGVTHYIFFCSSETLEGYLVYNWEGWDTKPESCGFLHEKEGVNNLWAKEISVFDEVTEEDIVEIIRNRIPNKDLDGIDLHLSVRNVTLVQYTEVEERILEYTNEYIPFYTLFDNFAKMICKNN